MTSDPLADRRATPATELPEAVEAQIREAREVLRADAEAAGVDPQLVDAAVDAAAASFVEARVHAFIGILVEREVRSTLRLAVDDATDERAGQRFRGARVGLVRGPVPVDRRFDYGCDPAAHAEGPIL